MARPGDWCLGDGLPGHRRREASGPWKAAGRLLPTCVSSNRRHSFRQLAQPPRQVHQFRVVLESVDKALGNPR